MTYRQQGQLIQADFFQNVGGLNVSDSPFAIDDSQATGGFNYEYVNRGGFRKRNGDEKLNSSADSLLKSLGIAQHVTSAGTKTVIRATDTKFQKFSIDGATFADLTEDTLAAGSTVLTSGSTQPVVFSQFNTTLANIMWAAGGGMSGIYGVYSDSKLTKNGSDAPTGSISTAVGAGTSTFAATGTYWYAVALRKASTQAVSLAALDKSATISNTTDAVTIDLTGLTSLDTTKYDKIIIYRSAVSGVTSFTTGDIIATLNSTATNYVDTGTSSTSATNIPRAGNTILDNSVLDSTGTYKVVTTWKRRLVTASRSTLYLSDLNKPESWPTSNTITIPSGGDITALGIISFTTTSSDTMDEILVVFKERELWVVTGTSISDWSLKFIDTAGCVNQSLLVAANGFLSWIDYRGIYLWAGADKPIYCSRPIEALWQEQGDLDKSKLNIGFGQFFRKTNQIIWCVSHRTIGEQKLRIKLDLRLTLPRVENTISSRVMDAVFAFDSTTYSIYAGGAFVPSSDKEEVYLIGDASGYIYKIGTSLADAGSGIDFSYSTRFLDMGKPGTTKRYHKVIVWVEDLGDWDLTLDYWTDYRNSETSKSSTSVQISDQFSGTSALWDFATWDVSDWDDYNSNLKPLVFNISSVNNNAEGDCIKLRFSQDGAIEPVTIHGFSVVYSESGMRK